MVYVLMLVVVAYASICGAQTRTQDLILRADDGDVDDQLGSSVAMSGDRVVVGAPLEDEANINAGAVYVFDAETGTQKRKLVVDDAGETLLFGTAVAIDGGFIAVSALGDSTNGPLSGAVYLFEESTGDLIRKIVPDDGVSNQFFGLSVDLHEGLLVVGGIYDSTQGGITGSAYVYDVKSGVLVSKLLADDGGHLDRFGESVSIEGNRVVVGAPHHTAGIGFAVGGVYVFDTQTGQQIEKLLPIETLPGAFFGKAVDLEGGRLAVGAPGGGSDTTDTGMAYVFDLNNGQAVELLPDNAVPLDMVGQSVAVEGNIVFVGTLGGNYVTAFDVETGHQQATLVSDSSAQNELLGSVVAARNSRLAAGQSGDDFFGVNSGAALIFDLSCSADTDNDGALTPADFNAWVNAFNNNLPACDQNGDGACTPADFTAWIANFNAGC
ncbi:MAG: hypothetical protein Phyf2KO_15940 [Phycisphaerales bacterium]